MSHIYDREKCALLFDIMHVFLPSFVPEIWPNAQIKLRQQLSTLNVVYRHLQFVS